MEPLSTGGRGVCCTSPVPSSNLGCADNLSCGLASSSHLREFPAAACGHSSALLFCHSRVWVPCSPALAVAELSSVTTSRRFSAFPSCFLQPPLQCSAWDGHPGVLTGGFAIHREELAFLGRFAALILCQSCCPSALQPMSLCHKNHHLGAGLSLCVQKLPN